MITIKRINGCMYDLIRDEKRLFSCASEENAQLAKAEIERLEADIATLRERKNENSLCDMCDNEAMLYINEMNVCEDHLPAYKIIENSRGAWVYHRETAKLHARYDTFEAAIVAVNMLSEADNAE